MEFLKSLEELVQPMIHEILEHPFLKRIKDASLTESQLQRFAQEYAIYCMHFPRFLAAIAANVDNDLERMPLIENLWEEHGEGILSRSHRNLYFEFLEALGLNKDQFWIKDPLMTTTICVENLMYLSKNAHYVESMGAIGLGTEYFTSQEYQIIAQGLVKYNFLDDSDVYFWTVHIGLDDHHYTDMMKGILPYLDKIEYQSMLERGAKRAIELEIMFWDGLEEYISTI